MNGLEAAKKDDLEAMKGHKRLVKAQKGKVKTLKPMKFRNESVLKRYSQVLLSVLKLAKVRDEHKNQTILTLPKLC